MTIMLDPRAVGRKWVESSRHRREALASLLVWGMNHPRVRELLTKAAREALHAALARWPSEEQVAEAVLGCWKPR